MIRRATIPSGWISTRAFEARFHEKPEQFASLAYDAMNALLDSICKAGLNRARIHDALADIAEYDGVTGHMVFDPNQKNVAHMYLGTVHNGTISYRVATMAPAVRPAPIARMEGMSSPATIECTLCAGGRRWRDLCGAASAECAGGSAEGGAVRAACGYGGAIGGDAGGTSRRDSGGVRSGSWCPLPAIRTGARLRRNWCMR